jgi:Penicillin-insensitive murein endopeptidase
MRLSRNRNWGNPQLVRFIERLAENAKKIGWNGLLVGEMSQPRGGPMLSDHKSHQIGLDVDIWLTPMPDHVQSRQEREFGSATDVVAPDLLDVDQEVWTHRHTELIRTAAQDPGVTRILVNAAIKKALCREAGADRAWLFKVRRARIADHAACGRAGDADRRQLRSIALSQLRDCPSSGLGDAIAIERGDRAGLGPDQACGCLAVAGLLVEAGRRGLKAQRLALCNSGDTAGTRDQVVGYGASDGPLWCGHPRRACRH